MPSYARYLLVTGKIARQALEKTLQDFSIDGGWEIKMLECSVAALMTTEFIAHKLKGDDWGTVETIVIPGLCQGPLEAIAMATGCQAVRGPADLKDLPAFLREGCLDNSVREISEIVEFPGSPIRILAEIVDAFRLNLTQIMARARYYRESGADIIDIGGGVDAAFPHVGEVVRTLKAEGFAVSIDSQRQEDILAACQAGADLVLSLNSANLELAKEVECPVVLIPDDEGGLPSLYRNAEKLTVWGVRYIVDPILPPLTMGLAEGICRCLEVRRRLPECAMLVGLSNVTELVDADSTGINAMLAGIAVELEVNYLLTTEVSHRARGTVRETRLACDLAHRAMAAGRLPKHLDYGLLTIKDPYGNRFSVEELRGMHQEIKDDNYRIFVSDQYIYVFNAKVFLCGSNARSLFEEMVIRDCAHAFYLGRELEKAELALKLGKRYVQDSPLRWGYMSEKSKRGEGGSP
ncbi:MAG: DUF6513 domain-containing protein [Negativicutes bacterium]|nr:DUF6513 domain-containing protein [Negativicutes bacterium]